MNISKTDRRLVMAALAWFVLSGLIAMWDWQDRWHASGSSMRYFVKLWMFWAQFAVWPLLMVALHQIVKARGLFRYGALILALGSVAAVWAGQIEPLVLRERHTQIALPQAREKPLKLALISDIHIGLFVRPWQLERIVERLNASGVDAVLIAGDWTYEPKLDLAAEFVALANLKMPIYAVLGNHDVEKPGPKLADPLREALSKHGVQWVEGRAVEFKGWEIVGLDDLWGGKPVEQVKALLTVPSENRLVLTHQPDALALVPESAMALGMAGHTHGGQVWLPVITSRLMQRTQRNPWYDGLYQSGRAKIFVTTGIGMSVLPFRFFVPPTIDIIHLIAS